MRPLPTSLSNLEHGNIDAVILGKQYSHIDNSIMYGHPKFARLMAEATAPRLRMGVGDGQATKQLRAQASASHRHLHKALEHAVRQFTKIGVQIR